MASIVRTVSRHPVTRALNPLTTGQAAKSNPAATVITLAATLVLLNVWKSQVTPDLTDVGKDVLLVVALVALATAAPRPVIGILWLALLLWVLKNGADVAALIQYATSSIPIGGK
jgi:hypothetical protein